MRLKAIKFAGYGSGVTDFATLLATVPQTGEAQLRDVVRLIAGQLTNPVPGLFVSVIVAGHSDRQDRADFTCDQRRASETAAAKDRAVSAWEWIKQEVTAEAALSGVAAGDWWDASPNVTWGLVFAAAGMLQHDPPTPAQRPLNRRVDVLVSIFAP